MQVNWFKRDFRWCHYNLEVTQVLQMYQGSESLSHTHTNILLFSLVMKQMVVMFIYCCFLSFLFCFLLFSHKNMFYFQGIMHEIYLNLINLCPLIYLFWILLVNRKIKINIWKISGISCHKFYLVKVFQSDCLTWSPTVTNVKSYFCYISRVAQLR